MRQDEEDEDELNWDLTAQPSPNVFKAPKLSAPAQEKVYAFDYLGSRIEEGLKSIGWSLQSSYVVVVLDELKELREIATSTNKLLVESKIQTDKNSWDSADDG